MGRAPVPDKFKTIGRNYSFTHEVAAYLKTIKYPGPYLCDLVKGTQEFKKFIKTYQP